MVAVGGEDSHGVSASGEVAEVKLCGVGVDGACDDLLADGVVDNHLANGVGALNVNEAAGGVGVDVNLKILHIVDAHAEGDGNPVVGDAAFVASGFETNIGISVFLNIDGIGLAPLVGRDGNFVLIPLESGMVGGVVDGLEVGCFAGQDMPVTLNMNFGVVVDGDTDTADRVTVLADGAGREGDGINGGGGVSGAGGFPGETLASGDGGVSVMSVVNHNNEVSDRVVA